MTTAQVFGMINGKEVSGEIPIETQDRALVDVLRLAKVETRNYMSDQELDEETFRLCAKVYASLSTLVDGIEKNRLQLRLPL